MKKNNQKNVKLLIGDCRKVMQKLNTHSVHMILTDPPYFLDGLDQKWQKGKTDTPRATGTIGGLPVGMKFSGKQGYELQNFIRQTADELIRILMPGGFFLSFSQPRLAHRLACGIEEAGFEIRDLYAWRFTAKAQFKAFSQDHVIDRAKLTQKQKENLKIKLKGRKTPQLKPQFEAIIMAQKPKKGTYIENWQKWGTGLIDATISLDSHAPATIMTVEKPTKTEKGDHNYHLTPKPVLLLEHLIKLFSQKGQTILDPFIGSGSTALAALKTERNIIGIDCEKDYIDITRKRIAQMHRQS